MRKRSSAIAVSLLVALYRPTSPAASFLLSSPRLFVHAFSFFFFFFVSFSLFFFRPATRLCIAETLCIASNILCDLIALALIHSGIFFIFNSTLKIILNINFFLFASIWG